MAEGMAESAIRDKKLQDIFLEGWKMYDDLEQTTMEPNNPHFQEKVRKAMENFESATRIVSQAELFSPNELIDEVTTESLQYLLLPYFLGKLALKLLGRDRVEVLNLSEIYLKDFIKRCTEYELCDNSKDIEGSSNNPESSNLGELAQLLKAAHARNNKLALYRMKKDLEEHIKESKLGVWNNTVDDEIKRQYFLNVIKQNIIDAHEELESTQLEKKMAEMRKLRLAAGEDRADRLETSTSQLHGHAHHHHHKKNQHTPQPPLQPFIITRNDAQKAVFGLGYPSLPIMTVGEFYQQRVHDGIFPDEQKVAEMNKAQALAAAQDPNEKEDQEQAALEEKIDADDEENLARMRRMDEYKDEVRRGDGNRYNRS